MTNLYISAIRLKKDSGYDASAYPFSLPVIQALSTLRLESPVTFFVGENGTGKSTLLEAVAIAYGFNAEGGSRNFHFATVETHSSLYRHLVLEKGVKRPKTAISPGGELFQRPSEIDRMEVEVPTAASRSTAALTGRAS
jgi:predicted ATPase